MTKNKNHDQPPYSSHELSEEEQAQELHTLAEYYTHLFLEEAQERGLIPEASQKDVRTVVNAMGNQALLFAETRGDASDRRRFAQALDPSLSEEEALLHHKATHDALTGAPNRYGLEEFLEKVEKPQALLYVDLTNFKNVNDTFGHERGDKVLIDMTEILTHALRSHDTIARIGGDEFVAVLSDGERNVEEEEGGDRENAPSTSEETAEAALQVVKGRVLAEILQYLNKNPDLKDIGFTAAIGGIVWKQGDTFNELSSIAEARMYQAKVEQHEEHGKSR